MKNQHSWKWDLASALLPLVIAIGLVACSDSPKSQAPTAEEEKAQANRPQSIDKQNFAYVEAPSGNPADPDDILLNRWIARNPGKRVISFTGIKRWAYVNNNRQEVFPSGVMGYILFYQECPTNRAPVQLFGKYVGDPSRVWSRETGYGIEGLQKQYELTKGSSRVIAFASVPASECGVESYTFLYEKVVE